MDSKETLEEKVRRELFKGSACCFEQTLGASLYAATTSHHTNSLSKTTKTCWALMERT